MKFLRVNLSNQKVQWEECPEVYQGLGGRALTSILVSKEVEATSDALGIDNKLVFAPGYFSGTALVNTSRLSVGAKSPLTGGIKESNVGGTVAFSLARLGVAAIVVEGMAPEGRWFLINIDIQGVATLDSADDLKTLRTYACVEKTQKRYGKDTSVTCIGPAGEMQLLSASIQSTDLDGRPCRAAGRGGLGAVMGAKGLKALVVSTGGKIPPDIARHEAFKAAAKAYGKAVLADEFSGELLPKFGSAVLVEPINAAGAFPTNNARIGQFAGAEKINGETMATVIEARGGKTTHKGCSQCVINCSNEYVTESGDYVTSSLEYETIWAMGGMIGNDNLDAIARLDFLCDDIGLDTINTGNALAVAFDAGYAEFGDSATAIRLVEEVASGTDMGRLIGNGPAAVGKHFNHDRVPTVKNQGMAAYDPRPLQGMAVTYATSPMGMDHTAGWVVDKNLEAFGGTVDGRKPDGQVELSRNTQIHMAAVDSVGICDFAQSGLAGEQGIATVYTMMGAKLGKTFTGDDWTKLGTRVIKAEREFNRRAGFTSADDRLPAMFYNEPLPPYNVVVQVTDEEMDSTFDF